VIMSKLRPSAPRAPWIRPPAPYAPRSWNMPLPTRSVPFLVLLSELARFGPAYTRAVQEGPANFQPMFISMAKFGPRERADIVPLMNGVATMRANRAARRAQALAPIGGPSTLYSPPMVAMPPVRPRLTPRSALNITEMPGGGASPLDPIQQRLRADNFLADMLGRGTSAVDDTMERLRAQFEG
jgi:hypothetical protein